MTMVLRLMRWVSGGLAPALVVGLVGAGAGSAWAAPQDPLPPQSAPPSPAPPPAATPAPTPAPPPSSTSQTPTTASSGSSGSKSTPDMQMPPAGDTYPNLKIVGFGDVDYSDTKRPEGPRASAKASSCCT